MMTEYDSHSSRRGHNPNDQDDQQQQQQQRASLLERGRSVKLMRNGDQFFTGRAFVINQRKYPMLDVFLDDASQALRANFGAVRCIYTPKTGTRLQDISEFQDHQTYVASGGERFKRLHYLDISEGKRISSKERAPPKLPPVRRYDVEGRALKLSRSENVIIYVYRNGDPLTLPAKILLVKPTLQNWESVLDEITKRVSLTYSAVLKLYAMNGELITSAQQLEYNGMYVAAGKERFKRIDYPDPKAFSPNSSPKMSRKSYTKSDGTNTHTTATSHGSNEYSSQRRPVREDYDFFSNKPQQHRRGPTKEIDFDRDDGGIYKGRLNHRERAPDIDETHHTKVDLPVNYREIETIDDENVFGNVGRTPRHQQPPLPNQIKTNQAVANSRKQSPPFPPAKTPTKHYGDDDDDKNKYKISNAFQTSTNHHDTNNNGFTNDNHRRNPPPEIDDDIIDEHDTQREQPFSLKKIVPSSMRSNEKDKDDAATLIQSHVRGYLTRKNTHRQQQTNIDQLTNDHEQQQNGTHKNKKDDQQYYSQTKENNTVQDLVNSIVQQALSEAILDELNQLEKRKMPHDDNDDNV